MKLEARRDVAQRQVEEAEAAVARQKNIIEELGRDGHSSRGALILLGLLEDALQNARKALAMTNSKREQAG